MASPRGVTRLWLTLPPGHFFMTHTALPYHLYVNVRNSYLGPTMPKGITKGIWHGIHSREGQMLMCHVLLETGAHWSGIPLHAISASDNFFDADQIAPWYAMGNTIIATQLPYLEGLSTVCRHNHSVRHGRHTGIMIDWSDGFSRYPQEHKPLNLIATDPGPFIVMPNNYITLTDKHFTHDNKDEELKHYKRNEQIFWEHSNNNDTPSAF